MKITQSFLLLLNLDSLMCLVEPSIELSSQDLELLSLKIGREVHRDYADAYAVSRDYADAQNELLPTPKFKGYVTCQLNIMNFMCTTILGLFARKHQNAHQYLLIQRFILKTVCTKEYRE